MKNTIFKSKIFSRSEPEFKNNFKEYFVEAEKQGLLNNDIVKQKRMSKSRDYEKPKEKDISEV